MNSMQRLILGAVLFVLGAQAQKPAGAGGNGGNGGSGNPGGFGGNGGSGGNGGILFGAVPQMANPVAVGTRPAMPAMPTQVVEMTMPPKAHKHAPDDNTATPFLPPGNTAAARAETGGPATTRFPLPVTSAAARAQETGGPATTRFPFPVTLPATSAARAQEAVGSDKPNKDSIPAFTRPPLSTTAKPGQRGSAEEDLEEVSLESKGKPNKDNTPASTRPPLFTTAKPGQSKAESVKNSKSSQKGSNRSPRGQEKSSKGKEKSNNSASGRPTAPPGWSQTTTRAATSSLPASSTTKAPATPLPTTAP